MARRDLLLGALIAASLTGNALLYRRGRAPRPVAAPAPVVAPASLADLWRQPFTAPPPLALDGCALRASWLAAQIAGVDRLRAQHTPAPRRFEEAPANPTLTAALAAELASHVPARLQRLVRADCRGHLCRVALPPRAHEAPLLRELRESAWLGDHLHELQIDAEGLLLEEHQPGSMRGSELLQQALQDFESSGAVEGCQAKFPGDGTLDAHLTLDGFEAEADPAGEGAPNPGDPGITVQEGGRLAGTPLGACIDGELRRALAALALPPRYERATLLAQFPRP